MSQRKQQKEIDKAIANLIKYGDQDPWANRQQYFYSEKLLEAADFVDVPVDEFCQTLADSGYKESPPTELIDAPELITASLDQHYRKILDEPIPMLNNLTPRECSKKTDQSTNLVQ